MDKRMMYDVKELAALLGCSERHIYRMVDNGKLPTPLKLGALNRWSSAVIDAWIAKGCPGCQEEVST